MAAPEEETDAAADAAHNNKSNSKNNNRTLVRIDRSPSARFTLPASARTYVPQYANVYFERLCALRPHARAAAEVAFGPPSASLHYAASFADISDPGDGDDNGDDNDDGNDDGNKPTVAKPTAATTMTTTAGTATRDCVLVGVTFRDAPHKPSILAEYERPHRATLIPRAPARGSRMYDPAQVGKLFLEDGSARCVLDVSGAAHEAWHLVSGMVVAVRGREHRATGAFRVCAVVLPQPAPQPPLPRCRVASAARRLVCIVSGLAAAPATPALELLLDALCGTFDNDDDDGATPFVAAEVTHAIVAGDTLRSPPPPAVPAGSAGAGAHDRLARPLHDADALLSAFAAALPVSVMAGARDPANALLPQQALHRSLLPSAARSANLALAPNPFACVVESCAMLGTSGQNVRDLALYGEFARGHGADADADADGTMGNGHGMVEANGNGVDGNGDGGYEADAETVLNILELLVKARHLAPTCPDTLGSYPFTTGDPFVLEQTPHVLFAGNQKEFGSRLMSVGGASTMSEDTTASSSRDVVEQEHNVRLISVPRFDRTGQAVFVDIDTLDCYVQEFGLSI